MTMKLFTAPEKVPDRRGDVPEIFLAGSIEQGRAKDWQAEVLQALAQHDVNVFNPRRENWDATWSQDITNPELVSQVNWELDLIERSDIVFFFFQGDTLSPISLLELGLVIKNQRANIVVVCEDGFWRKANVVITATRHRVRPVSNLQDGIAELLRLL